MAQTTPPPIDPVPTPPIQRGDRATFSARVDAFILWLVTAVTQFRNVALNVYNNAVDAFNSATTAGTARDTAVTKAGEATAAAGTATTKASEAATSATNAASSATGLTATSTSSVIVGTGPKTFTVQSGKMFVPGITVTAVNPSNPAQFVSGPVTSYSGTTLALNAASSGAVGTAANWNISVTGGVGSQGPAGQAGLALESRSSAAMIASSDKGKYIELSGTFTQAFDTPANLGAGFYVEVENASTGNITIPDSDGRTNWIMYPGEIRAFMSDGAVLKSKPKRAFYKNWTSLGSFVKPPGYTEFEGYLHDGGNSGARDTGASSSPFGGGGGGRFPFTVPASLLGVTETIQVGAGGAAVTATAASGNLGGVSAIGSVLTTATHSSARAGRGIVTGQDVISGKNVSGGFEPAPIGISNPSQSVYGGLGANDTTGTNSSIYGSGNGGSIRSDGTILPPGVSKMAGSGGAASLAGNGANGAFPGGGGGATRTGTQSGAGAGGEVVIKGRI